jgi:NAD(P)H-flavin reductase
VIAQYRLKVVKNERLNRKIFRTVLECVEPARMQLLAGQYLSLRVHDKARRSYSLSSLPGNVSLFETFVDITPQGPGSKFFENLQVGDAVEAVGPLGKFVFVERSDLRPVVFLATGTGITPFVSMLREQLQQKDLQRPIYLFWGLRYSHDLYLLAELEQLRAEHPNFQFTICLSQPDADWTGQRGYCTSALTESWEQIADAASADFYICGGAAMLAAARAQLAERGVTPESIFFEKFY